ncbi:PEP-CTERM sorting domain-containing protein [Rugamonas sp. CCM 8940]|nr:PEP-CTERM sorting domain-containing protein [Rugamonas sp. CCM 8940]
MKAYHHQQSLALRFSLSQTSSIDSILSSLQGDGNATFGIMSNAVDRPSNTWLYSATLHNPTQHSLLTPSNWILGAGTYWLTAYANDGFSGNWQGGATNSPYSFTQNPMVWYASQGIDAPATRITVSAVPEPATYGMLLAGMLLVAGAARRRN